MVDDNGNPTHDGLKPHSFQTRDDYRADALAVQDACNLRAIARLLVRAADAAADAGGTQASYDDPAVILIVGKIESLVLSQSGTRFADAWDACDVHERTRYEMTDCATATGMYDHD